MMMPNVFDYAVPKGSAIKSIKDLAGKKISVMSEGWSVIIEPMLLEAGVDPKSVTYQVAGPQWGQALAQGQADAALAWRGLGPQWKAQGMDFDYLVGKQLSKHPANGYVINRNDLKDPKKVDKWNRFFKCVAMGIEFVKQNPRAAAQITYEKFPALKEQMKPQLAFDSMWELDCNYWMGEDLGKGIGYSDIANWDSYIDALYKLGQIKTRPKTEDIVTNQFVDAANKFDKARVTKDAQNYKLNADWSCRAGAGGLPVIRDRARRTLPRSRCRTSWQDIPTAITPTRSTRRSKASRKAGFKYVELSRGARLDRARAARGDAAGHRGDQGQAGALGPDTPRALSGHSDLTTAEGLVDGKKAVDLCVAARA